VSLTLTRSDVREFPILTRHFDVIVADMILQFMPAAESREILKKTLESLTPGGSLLVRVWSANDPACLLARISGTDELEPNSYLVSDGPGIVHYFTAEEILDALRGARIYRLEEQEQQASLQRQGRRGVTLLCHATKTMGSDR
jgi:trans-aconitate methyltransferase